MPINRMMFRILFALTCVQAQERIITTAVGTDWLFNGDGKPALDAPLGFARAVAVGPDGIYFSDPDNAIVGRIGADGKLTVVAGNGVQGVSSLQGSPTSRSLTRPDGAAVDSKGRVAFFESGTIWLLTEFGAIRFAGGGTSTAEDVAATSARVNASAIVFGPDDSLYVMETGTHRVRRIVNGVISTIAGNGAAGFSGDNGPAVRAQLHFPEAIAVGRDGVLYIADWSNRRVRRVDTQGVITTVATHLNSIAGVGVDNAGRVFFSDFRGIYRVVGAGEPVIVAGGVEEGYTGDGGPAARAAVFDPHSIVFDAAGNMYFADLGNMRIRRVSASGIISTIAGNDRYRESREGVAAVAAALNRPEAVAVAADGTLWVANSGNWSVHRRTADGSLVRVYGSRTIGHPQRRSQFGVLIPLANGEMLSRSPFQVYSLSATGRLTTLFGGACCEAARDGDPAADVQFAGYPAALAVAPNGDIYFGEDIYNRHRILRVDRTGRVRIVAGTGAPGFSGDGGPATSAAINYATFYAFDRLGNFYFSDSFNNRIRRVDTRGVISTIAGNGSGNVSPDHAPATGPICSPRGLAFDGSGLLHFAEGCNGRVRRISSEGTLETIAGSTTGFSGDGGPAIRARLNNPAGIAFDPAGNLYVADTGNHRIRVVLAAQPTIRITPTNATISAGGSGSIDVIPSTPGQLFTAFSTANWLTVTPPEGSLPATVKYTANFAGLEPGTKTATITIQSGASTETFTLTANVPQAAPARLSVSTPTLSFSVPKGAAETSGSLTVSNPGGAALPVTLGTNQPWLRIEPSTLTLSPGQETALSITLSPSALNAGTYSGAVTIRPTGLDVVTIPVTLAVSEVQGKLLISQRGLSFTAVSQGGAPLPQSVGVLNVGAGSLNWTARISTFRGGDWLRATPASGESTANSLIVPTVDVAVSARNLAPGEYQGQIEFLSNGAVNSPQRVTVSLQVLPPGSNPGPELSASGLIFTSYAGDDSASQNVFVSNPSAVQAQYASGRLTFDGANWLSHTPQSASVQPDDPGRIVVAPDSGRLGPGVYRGAITLQFFDGSIRTINVLNLVVGAEFRTTANGRGAACNPARLLPQWSSPRENAAITIASAASLQVKVIDDCGQPLMQNGTVVARFSNGDPPVPMVHTGNGVWSATWLPARAGSAKATAVAVLARGTNIVAATADLNANVLAGGTTPVVARGAVLNAASFVSDSPIAPGSLVSIFGERLAQSQQLADGAALSNQLGGTEVLLAGRNLPLRFVSPGQINAQIPYDLTVNTEHQIVVRQGERISVPESITVAAAQPAIFTVDLSGKGQGAIFWFRSNGASALAAPSSPARAGDVLVAYATGLGVVRPNAQPGQPAPSSPLAQTVETVEVTVGDQPAAVQFSGLSPGFAGLYQINFVVPDQAPRGPEIPIRINVAGQSGNAVSVAIE